MSKLIQWLTLLLSVSLFAASLTQIAYCIKVGAGNRCVDALSALLLGWFGMLLINGPSISWVANIFLIVAWIMQFTTTSKYTLGVAVFSSLIMLSFARGGEILIDEAGNHSKIISLGFGYWLWLMSALILIIGNGFILFLGKKR